MTSPQIFEIIRLLRAGSSVGERLLDTQEVAGSIPVPPTTVFVNKYPAKNFPKRGFFFKAKKTVFKEGL